MEDSLQNSEIINKRLKSRDFQKKRPNIYFNQGLLFDWLKYKKIDLCEMIGISWTWFCILILYM